MERDCKSGPQQSPRTRVTTHYNNKDSRQHSFLTALHECLAAQINLLLNDGTHKKLCIPGKVWSWRTPKKEQWYPTKGESLPSVQHRNYCQTSKQPGWVGTWLITWLEPRTELAGTQEVSITSRAVIQHCKNTDSTKYRCSLWHLAVLVTCLVHFF